MAVVPLRTGLIALTLLWLIPVVNRGEPSPATRPATAPVQSLAITVTGVEGMVQVREGDGQPWRKAVAGMTVGEGAEFRTGPRSAVRCLVPPDQTFTLDRLGVVKVLQAIRDGKVVKTKVGMPFGRTRYDIEAAGVEHQTSMVTPSSTLAIRGTRVSVFDQPPFAPSAVSLTGRAEYRTAKRQIAFGGKGEGRTDVSSQIESPGELSLLRSYVDPASHFGRPDEDERLISQLQAKGDLVLRNGELAVAFGGPVTDRQLVDITRNQGRFNIALRWFGPGDFDLFVLTPDPKTGLPAYTLGNPSYRGSIFKDIGLFQSTTGQDIPAVTAGRTADGGRIRFDQIAFGKGGLELASWNTPVPQVPYTIAVAYYNHLTEDPNYPASGSFQVDAFLDGKRVPLMQNYQAVRDVQAAPVFGPVYQNTVQLLGRGSTILVNPPSDFNGQFDLTSADLSPEAAGNINPSSSSSRSARRSRDKSVTAAAAQPSGRARRR